MKWNGMRLTGVTKKLVGKLGDEGVLLFGWSGRAGEVISREEAKVEQVVNGEGGRKNGTGTG